MKFITVTEAKQTFTHIVSEIEETKEEFIVTKNGRPVVLMRHLSEDEFQLKGETGGRKEAPYGEKTGNLQEG